MSNNVKAEVKKEFKLEQVLAMWKRKSAKGATYFTGRIANGENCIGFYNTKKQNPKEPDIRIHLYDGDEIAKEVYLSLWCNVTKNEKKILSGKLDGKRVVGFINASGNEKQPYFTVYFTDEAEAKPEAVKEEKPKSESIKRREKIQKEKFEEVEPEELPF